MPHAIVGGRRGGLTVPPYTVPTFIYWYKTSNNLVAGRKTNGFDGLIQILTNTSHAILEITSYMSVARLCEEKTKIVTSSLFQNLIVQNIRFE